MTRGSDAPGPRSVYVHVPFCVHRCHYCDFSVSPTREPPIRAFLDAIDADLDDWFGARGWETPLEVDTLFVGGGTPSLLGGDGMRGLARRLARRFRWDPDTVEWTAEANPTSLTMDVCEAWRDVGVTRLSIGVQSFQDGPLAWLGRRHDAQGAVAAIERARAAGFGRISVDLIFGLPEFVRREWRADVERVTELRVGHVSTYGLTAEPRTPLGRRVELGRVRLADEKRYEAEFLEAATRLGEAGFEHYEVSNFALEGHASRHNWHYWDGTEYLGVGPSAHSYLAGERIWNVYRWDEYRRAAESGASLRAGRERPEPLERSLERIWLGLRTREGLRREDAPTRGHEAAIDAWRREGWLTVDEDRVQLTPRGWLRLDAIAAELATWKAGELDDIEEIERTRETSA